MNSRRVVVAIRWIVAFGALAGIVIFYHRVVHVNPTTVALTLLLLILLLAAEWGLHYAVTISLVATAAYNFYFLPPIGTFIIADPQNWLALFTFLATAIVASRLSQRARNQAEQARARQRELEALLHLSRELLQTEATGTLVSSMPAAVAGVTKAGSVLLYLLDSDRLYRAGNAAGDIEIPYIRQIATALNSVHSEGDEIQVPLHSGVRPRGLLLLRGVSISDRTAEAIGGLLSIAMDRAQALENLAREEAAKESERLRALMTDSITHELRTPLTSIKGAATALLAGGVSAEDSKELLSVIDEESDRLNRLVSEAVEMAQLDAHQVQMHFTAVNALQMVQQACAECAWVQEEHAVQVEVPSDLVIQADPEFLQKVLCNLLENAARYSKPKTPITISAATRGNFVEISVADRGMGIDPAEQSLIFERFYRARAQAGESAGTGMGLAISRAIVAAHHGEMSLTSQPGHGSVFSFNVPRA